MDTVLFHGPCPEYYEDRANNCFKVQSSVLTYLETHKTSFMLPTKCTNHEKLIQNLKFILTLKSTTVSSKYCKTIHVNAVIMSYYGKSLSSNLIRSFTNAAIKTAISFHDLKTSIRRL